MNEHIIELQFVSDAKQIPSLQQFQAWTQLVLADQSEPLEIVVRIVDADEMSELNVTYRHKSGPTNILSFPFEVDTAIAAEFNLLGDLVLCAPIIEQEAIEQGKPLINHWAHIFIHGVLHLLGYDHIENTEAELMEALEIEILSKLQINNPYQEPLNS